MSTTNTWSGGKLLIINSENLQLDTLEKWAINYNVYTQRERKKSEQWKTFVFFFWIKLVESSILCILHKRSSFHHQKLNFMETDQVESAQNTLPFPPFIQRHSKSSAVDFFFFAHIIITCNYDFQQISRIENTFTFKGRFLWGGRRHRLLSVLATENDIFKNICFSRHLLAGWPFSTVIYLTGAHCS